MLIIMYCHYIIKQRDINNYIYVFFYIYCAIVNIILNNFSLTFAYYIDCLGNNLLIATNCKIVKQIFKYDFKFLSLLSIMLKKIIQYSK